jgi:hypothetical protein
VVVVVEERPRHTHSNHHRRSHSLAPEDLRRDSRPYRSFRADEFTGRYTSSKRQEDSRPYGVEPATPDRHHSSSTRQHRTPFPPPPPQRNSSRPPKPKASAQAGITNGQKGENRVREWITHTDPHGVPVPGSVISAEQPPRDRGKHHRHRRH